MTISYDEKDIKKGSIIMVFILLSIILLYPDSAKGYLIYIPQLITGFIALVSLLKFPIIRPVKSFLIYALYMTITNFILSIMNQSANVFDIFISSLRLYYPFLGLVIGMILRNKIKPKLLLKILLFFLTLESVIVFFQINNLSFRVWSYNLYRATNVDYYLNAFAWQSGRRSIGTIGNPNLLGMLIILLYSSVLFLSNLIAKKGIRKLVNIISIIMSLYVCINVQSRTAILLWCFTTIFIMHWKFPRKGLEKIFYLYLLIFVVVILIFYFQTKISREISLSALDSRINIWQTQISQMFDYAKYEDFFASILGIGFKTARNFGTFDNTYVKVFVSGGLIGLSVFLKTIIDILKAFLIKKPRDIWRGLGLAIIFIWILGSIVAEYQEAFKLSIMTFIILGYALHTNEENV